MRWRSESATAPDPSKLQWFFDKSVQRMRTFQDWTADQMRSIRAPTLILIGDRDIVRPEHAVQIYRLLPDAQLAILPATDHMKMIERASWAAPMIEQFLDSPPPASE